MLCRSDHYIMMSVLQLLDSPHAEVINKGISLVICKHGQDVVRQDVHLALEYFWQAAAVVGGSSFVQVQPNRTLQVLHECAARGLFHRSTLHVGSACCLTSACLMMLHHSVAC